MCVPRPWSVSLFKRVGEALESEALIDQGKRFMQEPEGLRRTYMVGIANVTHLQLTTRASRMEQTLVNRAVITAARLCDGDYGNMPLWAYASYMWPADLGAILDDATVGAPKGYWSLLAATLK